MARLCERPGCAQPATVTYGMSADDLSVWLEPYDGATHVRLNVLCRRHADAMVVPKGWTLDDRRDPVPRLFKPADPLVGAPAKRSRQRPRKGGDDTGQLEFTVAEIVETNTAPSSEVEAPANAAGAERDAPADPTTEAWRPVFDQTDDLDGLLTATSPLLSRAFGKRPRPSPTEG